MSFFLRLRKLSFVNEIIDLESLEKITELTLIVNQNSQIQSIDQIVSNEESNQMDTNQNFTIYDLGKLN